MPTEATEATKAARAPHVTEKGYTTLFEIDPVKCGSGLVSPD